YLAIVWGWPAWDHRRVEWPLEPDGDSPYRVKMRVAAPGSGQPSATTFEVQGRRQRPDGRRYAMIRCTLHSGRQHQIRVHARREGFPLVGDKLYGPDEGMHARGADGELTAEDRVRLELPRQALHASQLTLDHPETGHRITLEAPLYDDLARFWASLPAQAEWSGRPPKPSNTDISPPKQG
ncbi:MAG: hypothetical protein AAGA56_11950, partial [Myxococcota bacterium]